LESTTKPRRERLQSIMSALLRSERITVEKLSAELGVSGATIRRDLFLLEEEGLLRRDHGGAGPVEPLIYEAFALGSSFREEVERQAAEKKRIGLAAAETIEDGETVALSAGTTTTQVARSIPFHKHINVFTNAVNIAMELSHRKNIVVTLTGGTMRGGWFSLVGPEAIDSARHRIFDKIFIGANGVSPDVGLTDHHAEEAAVNRVLLAQARRCIVVADHTKFSVVASCVVGGVNLINTIVTDEGTPDAVLQPFRDLGVEVLRAYEMVQPASTTTA